MANRNLVPEKGGLDKGRIALFATIATGAAGAVGAASAGKGFASFTRNSAGLYTVVLQDKYVGMLAATATVRGTAGTGVPTAAKAAIAVPFNPVVGGAAANSIQIQCLRTDTMVAADVTDNWFIDIELTMKDSLV
jgi:hypothetical protein